MLDSVKDYLHRTMLPDLAATLEDSDQLLESIEVRSHEIALEQEVNWVDIDGNDNATVAIYAIYLYVIKETISLHGITLDTEDLGLCNDILKALIALPDHAETDRISNIIESAEDDLTKFSELVSLITLKEPIEYAGVITGVVPGVFDLLVEIGAPELNVIDQRFEKLSKDIVERVSTLIAAGTYKDTFGLTWVAERKPIGLDIDVYLNELPALTVGAMADSAPRAALELLAIAVVSNTPNDHILEAIRTAADAQFSNLEFINLVEIAVLNLLGGKNG